MSGLRILFGTLMLTLLGMFPIANVNAQSLAEVLTAIQKRKQLIEERGIISTKLFNDISEYYGGYSLPIPEIKLIDWGVGADYPDEGNVNALSVDKRISLLRQAFLELDKLKVYYVDGKKIKNGKGVLERISFESFDGRITLENYFENIRVLAQRIKCFALIDWPVKGDSVNSGRGKQDLDALPDPPLSSENHMSYGDGYGGHIWSADSGSYLSSSWYAISIYGGSGDSDSDGVTKYSYVIADHQSGGDLQEMGAPSYPGKIQFYSGTTYRLTAIDGLQDSDYRPWRVLIGETETVDDSWTHYSPLSGLMAGDLTGITFPGSWWEKTDGVWCLAPKFKGQENTQLSKDLDTEVVNGMRSYWNPVDRESAEVGALYGNALSWNSYFVADFHNEFSGASKLPPESPPFLQVESKFERGELKTQLANTPEGDCELVWKFPKTILMNTDIVYGPQGDHSNDDLGALAARNVLTVRGDGDWDAVYSGRVEDREEELKWQGHRWDVNKRWPNFDSYVNEWWRPVLKQVVCKTYGVNITQDQSVRARYQIDFYRRDQVGDKNNSTGEYSFSGDPIDTYVVENPENDDAAAGRLKITIHKGKSNEATYDVTLTQTKTKDTENDLVYIDSLWKLSAKQGQQVILDKEVKVTAARYDDNHELDNPYKVEDATTLNQVTLPTVTTTYLDDWANPQRIDKVVEGSGANSRTTTYSYAKDSDGNITHLSDIAQTGGVNPYTAEYHNDAGLLTHYQDTYGSMDVSYSGSTVTRTEKTKDGSTVRTLTTTYSGDMAQATTVAN